MLALLHERGDADFAKVEGAVRTILEDVRKDGDAAVRRYVERFEKRVVATLFLSSAAQFDGAGALARLPADAREALEYAADRIRRFHTRERETMFAGDGFRFEDEGGASLGLRVRPLDRVGVYAPGGKARYPSSVLMSAIPAHVAGVPSIVLASPLAGDATDDMILAAAHLSGVTGIVDAGGAQAIGALAYGTATIPRVDKIVGPGNAYVACAKRLVYGTVAIDSIAGPSEILVLADRTADPRHVAADLLSQAEHDEDAYALLASDSRRARRGGERGADPPARDASAARDRERVALPPRSCLRRGRPRRPRGGGERHRARASEPAGRGPRGPPRDHPARGRGFPRGLDA